MIWDAPSLRGKCKFMRFFGIPWWSPLLGRGASRYHGMCAACIGTEIRICCMYRDRYIAIQTIPDSFLHGCMFLQTLQSLEIEWDLCGVWAGSLLFCILVCECFHDISKVCLQLSRVSTQNRPAEWQPQDKNMPAKINPFWRVDSTHHFRPIMTLLRQLYPHPTNHPLEQKILWNIDRAFARRVCHMSASFRVKLMARPSPTAAFGWRTLRRPSPPGTVPHHPSSWTSVLAWIPRLIHS